MIKPGANKDIWYVEYDADCSMYYIRNKDKVIQGETFSKEFAESFVKWHNIECVTKLKEKIVDACLKKEQETRDE